ncbi:MAG: CBS domain-containing protein [Candidatus Altiarchaeota archaeon]|nr:CBS domain-containing protein [Candidatus Altiarchaeota archaeon]
MSLEKAESFLKRFGYEACQKLVLRYKMRGFSGDELKALSLDREDVEDINRLTLHRSLRVYNIMTPGTLEEGILTIWKNDTIENAARIMSEHQISSLIVVDLGKPVGIITERDIVQKVVGPKKKLNVARVDYYMSSPIQTIEYSELLDNAAYKMSKEKIKKLVVTMDGKISGIVTTTDFVLAYREIIKKLIEKTNEEVISEIKPDWK